MRRALGNAQIVGVQLAALFGDDKSNVGIFDHRLRNVAIIFEHEIDLDDRRLVGFMRDASVITEQQYLALPRPTKINDFPGDLARYPGLEYSGLFEDGWVAEDAFFKLGPSRAGQILTFKGTIPETKKFREQGVDVTVSINEKPTEIVNLKSGDFTLTRLIKEATQITSISLHFSDAQVYGTEDPRAVSAAIREISIGDQDSRTVAGAGEGAQDIGVQKRRFEHDGRL